MIVLPLCCWHIGVSVLVCLVVGNNVNCLQTLILFSLSNTPYIAYLFFSTTTLLPRSPFVSSCMHGSDIILVPFVVQILICGLGLRVVGDHGLDLEFRVQFQLKMLTLCVF